MAFRTGLSLVVVGIATSSAMVAARAAGQAGTEPPAAAPITAAPRTTCFDRLRRGQDLSSAPADQVTVSAGIDIIDIRTIDGASETFSIDFYLILRWNDPRIASPELADLECVVAPQEVWSAPARLWGPRHEFINLRSEDRNDNAQIALTGSGTVRYSARISGSFDADFSLSNFPFDTQTLSIQIESGFDAAEVILAPLERLAGGEAAKGWKEEMPQWTVDNLQTSETKTYWVSSDAEFSRFSMTVRATRRYGFYVWKVFVPLLLIIVLSWTVFWMSSDHFDGQMAVSITCLLALIAFNFVIGDELPKISYLTVLDWAILLAYIFVFLAALENVVVHMLARRERQQSADRVERACRWLFPLTYIIANAVLLIARA